MPARRDTATTGRLFSLLMVTCTFVLLPLQTSKLIELYSSRDPFAAAFNSHADAPHIVIFGAVSAPTIEILRAQLLTNSDGGRGHRVHAASVAALRRLHASLLDWERRLRESVARMRAQCGDGRHQWLRCLGGDSGDGTASAGGWLPHIEGPASTLWSPQASVLLVLSTSPPDAQVRRLLLEQSSPRWLYWLVGTALSTADLSRAGIEHAAAALVINETWPSSQYAFCHRIDSYEENGECSSPLLFLRSITPLEPRSFTSHCPSLQVYGYVGSQ